MLKPRLSMKFLWEKLTGYITSQEEKDAIGSFLKFIENEIKNYGK